MARLPLLAAVLLLASAASAQTFRPAGGPWTRAHELVGSTPDGRVFARVGTRLAVTTDAGQTWTVVSETVAPSRIAGDGSAIYGAFPDGVRLSRDGGSTWTRFGLDGLNIRDIALSETVYALTESAVYRLSDLGLWQLTVRPGEVQNAALRRLDAAGGTIAVAALEPSCSGFLAQATFFRSRDAGATWSRTLGTGFPQDVAVAPNGTAYFATVEGEVCAGYMTPGGLFELPPTVSSATLRSGGDAGGVAINGAGQPVTVSASQASEVVTSNGSVLFGTRPLYGSCFDPPCGFTPPSGLYALRNGRFESVGFVPSRVDALSLFQNEPVVPSDGAVYLLGAGLHAVLPLGLVRSFVSVPGAPGALLALAPGQQIPAPPFVGSGGLSYPNALALGGPSPSGLSLVSTASAVSVEARIVTASNQYGRAGVFVTAQDGYPTLTLEADDIGTVGGPGEILYAGSIDDVWQFGSSSPAPSARIFRSDDDGDTWTPDDAGMSARNVYAFTSAGSLHLAGTSGGVFARAPGAPWQAGGLAGRTVFMFYDAPDGLLAGTDDGIFRRDAAGAWTRYGSGLDGRSVYAVLTTTDATGAWTGVGTDAGLYQTRAFGLTAETEPAASALSVQTFPNPAHGLRTVRVSGTPGEPVAVAVFDALGRIVADLGTVATGDVAWDASGLPAGVYVVRVTTEAGASASVRAVVVR